MSSIFRLCGSSAATASGDLAPGRCSKRWLRYAQGSRPLALAVYAARRTMPNGEMVAKNRRESIVTDSA